MIKLHALFAVVAIPRSGSLHQFLFCLLSSLTLPVIPLPITQLTQQNQSVLNFSWDLGDLLMNLQRREKLTVLSYAWCR